MEGWIKIHRKILNWEWYDDINTKVLFLHLLLTANHQDKQWRGKVIKRGQRLTSISHLAEEIGLTIKQTRVSLDKLKRTNEIVCEGANKYTLITIEKYCDYQLNENEKGEQEDEQEGKRRANKGQTKGKQRATNKNDKNDNNVKNERNNNISAKANKQKYGEYKNVLLKDEELQKLKENYSNWEELIKYLDEYIEMKGYKAQSHYLCIKKWVIDAVKRQKINNVEPLKNYDYKGDDTL